MKVFYTLACLLFLAPVAQENKAPFDEKEVFKLANEVILKEKEGSEWRVSMKSALGKYLEQLSFAGADIRVRAEAEEALKNVFSNSSTDLRSGQDVLEGKVYILDHAKGKHVKPKTLLICKSGKFEKVEDSVVICLGDFEVTRKLDDSLVFAKGRILVGRRIDESVVFSGGDLESQRCEDSVLFSHGTVRMKDRSEWNVFVNPGKLELEETREDVHLNIKSLPGYGRK